ncbi:tetratricopeptide repeat protein [Solihabitans fulvus]|uniref:Tetratricopeptide repeat protein n=1 Tax=Solihabitans fulvus TaxID=1892852 RepID=A0A5B2WXR6_9PSEU|nr:AfsR/SARP family transcriptional regulator [Solihabitans fulvus]KAA2256345.1 tetratricopeptide repeat protein [Solihabitans fulvus]
MRFRILGSIEAHGTAGRARLAGARQLALLSTLLLNTDSVVPTDELVDAVWGDAPPNNATSALHTYVSRLRRVLGAAEPDAEARLTFGAGYRLRVAPDELDVVVFRELVARARAASADHPSDAAADLRAALALWRGPALAGLSGRVLRAHAARLAEEHTAALEERIAVDLALGSAAELVEELRELVAAQPLRERPRGQLMLALYRCGRQAEALRAYRDGRELLGAELGIEPGADLRELHEQILRGAPELTLARRAPRTACRNDLPRDVPDFTGRTDELRRLLAVLPARHGIDADPARRGGAAVVIEAIDGMAGVGKTALAVHAAHRLAEHYPDAQLFVDLHGHTTAQAALDPSAALDLLLRAIGVPGDRIPVDPDERAALWRASLAERRALVVLDNAADTAQVRPLLPGAPGCLALITSRRRLAGLETAAVLSLDVLPQADAVGLFGSVAGRNRTAREPEATREVTALCGQLPLAVRIAAARLRTRPAWSVAHLADRLRAGRTELSTEDSSVTVAFSLSYRQLSDDQQRLFRLLGLVTGPDVDAHAVAALADLDPRAADRLLEDLVDVHLLQERTPGRYRFHDLLRRHAEAIVARSVPEVERRAALARLVDFYLHTAHAADLLLYPQRPAIEPDLTTAAVRVRTLADETAALAWFDAERPCLLAAQRVAVEAGRPAQVWRLAWAMNTFCQRRGHLADNLEIWRAGLAAAVELGDLATQALAHRLLGHACARVGRHDQALAHLGQALSLAERTGDVQDQAHTHRILTAAWAEQGDERRALGHAVEALRIYRAVGNPVWEAMARNAAGWLHARLGEHDAARPLCEQALAMFRQHLHREGEATALDSLGYIAHHTGWHADAVTRYEHALALLRELGNSYEEAHTLARLGEAYAALRRPAEASEAWRQASTLYRAQGRAAELAETLRRLDSIGQQTG